MIKKIKNRILRYFGVVTKYQLDRETSRLGAIIENHIDDETYLLELLGIKNHCRFRCDGYRVDFSKGDGAAILKDGIAMNVEEIVTELNKLAVNSNRYKYIRENQVWHRYGDLADDSHALVGCRFPYLANFESKPMLDYNIDKMIQAQSI